MTLYYLPIESSKREILSKTFLASRLASLGHEVIVFRSDLFDRIGWPAPGIYIGKNCFRTERPYSTKYYDRMKAAGIDVWHHDEEGGLYVGENEGEWRRGLFSRLNPATLNADDKILTWGAWQAEAFKELSPDAEVRYIGSPSFDLMQEKYSEALFNFDLEQTDGLNGYILVNTRFTCTNGFMSAEEHLSGNGPTAESFTRLELAEQISSDGLFLYSFINLVQKIAESYPNDRIVLRPHPAENSDLYRTLLSAHPNVTVAANGDVGSWIRRCKAVIQNGCTTALQAKINGAKVFTYFPFDCDRNLMADLPNQVGKVFSNPKELMSIISQNQTNDRDIWGRTISKLNSIDELADLAGIACSNIDSRQLKRQLNRLNLKEQLFKLLKMPLRPLFSKKYKQYKLSNERFDTDFFKYAPNIHLAATKYMGVETKLTAYDENFYFFEPVSHG